MKKKSSLLIVEDNPHLSQTLARSLKHQYCVEQVTTLSGAYQHVAEEPTKYDVILLDNTLPDGDGIELLPWLQNSAPQARVCLLSDKIDTVDFIEGLSQGADAYLPKPIHLAQIHAQIQTLLRRGKIFIEDVLFFRDLHLHIEERYVTRANQRIDLSKRETEFLSVFCQSELGRATQEDINNYLWNQGLEVSKSMIHTTMQRLRRKLAPLRISIKALYGLGYELELQETSTENTSL